MTYAIIYAIGAFLSVTAVGVVSVAQETDARLTIECVLAALLWPLVVVFLAGAVVVGVPFLLGRCIAKSRETENKT